MKIKKHWRMVMSTDNGYIYLAQPYSSPDPEIIAFRVAEGFKATAKLMNEGHIVFAPIVHTHELGQHVDPELSKQHDFWMRQDIAILRHATELRVLMLPGWEESKGVAQEILVAEICMIPVTFMEPV
jgi:hypothetical protein